VLTPDIQATVTAAVTEELAKRPTPTPVIEQVVVVATPTPKPTATPTATLVAATPTPEPTATPTATLVAATPTPEPTATPKPTPAPPPLEVTITGIKENSIGIPDLFLKLTNKSKRVVDGYEVRICPKNVFGEALKSFGFGGECFIGTGSTVLQPPSAQVPAGYQPLGNLDGAYWLYRPGNDGNDSEYWQVTAYPNWTLNGYDSAVSADVGLNRVHFVDGALWTEGRLVPIGDAAEGMPDALPPELILDPTSSGRGSTVRVTGSGFPTNRSVTVAYGPSVVARSSTDTAGKIVIAFIVPYAEIPSRNSVAVTPKGFTPSVTTHSVPGPTVSVIPGNGKGGAFVTVTGRGFPGFAGITSFTLGGLVATTSPPRATDRDGSFTASIVIPAVGPGNHAVLATAGGATAVTTFVVDP
jgi:hypothetical protein